MSLLKKEKFQFNAEVIHDRLISLEDLIQNLSTNDVEVRIASMLLNLAKDFGVEGEDGIIIELPLNREYMANYIGITRETMSRKLTSLQDENVIELVGNKKIIIKNKTYFKDMI